MLRSFIEVNPESHFPIQNIPFGVFSKNDGGKRIGTAIGDYVLDLTLIAEENIIKGDYFKSDTLNLFIKSGKDEWRRIRYEIQNLLSIDTPTIRDNQQLRDAALLKISTVVMHLPVAIGDYTDFYSSKEHAANVGSMFRDPNNALLPNWLHLPVAYHGRASSVVVSGTPIRRPLGQTKGDDQDLPVFGASKLFDFELEVGCIIGKENKLGSPIPVGETQDHAFGLVLVNDWSARDIQKWEYVPLGPFLAKNFATSISPWIVTMEALEEFKVPGPEQNPVPLPYLRSNGNLNYNLELEVKLTTKNSKEPETIVRSNYSYMYWNLCQQIAHHTSNGCNLNIGDLLASGTISGSTPESYGSMLELCWKGTKPITLSSGEVRKFLEDYDVVTMTGYGQGSGYRIGFGEVVGEILPAVEF